MLPAAFMDLFRAQRFYRIRNWDACITACTLLLEASPYDQAAWLLKCRALTERAYVDELEWEDEEGGGDGLLDDHAVATAPRPGTSLSTARPAGAAAAGAGGGGFRPATGAARPVTGGFARLGTSSGGARAPAGGSALDAALRGVGGRAATARASTSGGRALRLGTASMLSAPGGAFIDAARLDLRRYAARPPLAKALAAYLLHVEHAPRRVLELGALATEAANFSDWWWKAALARAYGALGMLGEAERQFASALKGAPWNVALKLHLGRVAVRMDQPAAALLAYGVGGEGEGAAAGGAAAGGDVSLLLAAARLQEARGDAEGAAALRRRALHSDASCAEATACLAAAAFYNDQPEVALRLYRRLLLAVGATGAPSELWVNLGLCTFHAGQYDLSMPCLERALAQCSGDGPLGDVWYNIGTIGVMMGDGALALQAFSLAVAADPAHPEARTNLGVLEARKGNAEAARAHYAAAQKAAPGLFEPWYNGALLEWRAGDVAAAFELAGRALAANSEHADSKELLAMARAALLSGTAAVEGV